MSHQPLTSTTNVGKFAHNAEKFWMRVVQVFRANRALLLFPALFLLLVLSSFAQHVASSGFESGPRNVVLVTGGAGFLGTHSIAALLQRDTSRRVLAVDNFVNSSPRAVARLQQLLDPEQRARFKFVKVDLTSWREMHVIFLTYGHVIESCIHFGGLKAVTDSIEHVSDGKRKRGKCLAHWRVVKADRVLSNKLGEHDQLGAFDEEV
jgi:hypothetical protein